MLPLHDFTTTRTARYALLGTPDANTRSVWFCLHDAGQSVAELADQLSPLDTPERLLVLPEGLAYYPSETASANETPGSAAWLTLGSNYLLPELTDLTAYLDALAKHILTQCPPGVPVTVLGCGQGAAAACRWLSGNRISYERLILYAAVFPPDFDRRATLVSLPERPVTVVATTVDTLTPEAAGEGLLQDLLDVGLEAIMRHVTPGPITLAALGPVADASATPSAAS